MSAHEQNNRNGSADTTAATIDTASVDNDRPSKTVLRHRALARRKLTTPEERREAGEQLVRHLSGELASVSSHGAPLTVAAYVSMGTEVETRPLLRWLLEHGCTVLVPRLGSGLEIGWSTLTSVDTLLTVPGKPAADGAHTTHLRPDEPAGAVLPPEALREADVVIAPALGVDPQGYRLGRGAGWYDRALTLRRQGCPLIAVCWSWEVMDRLLPTEPHDVPADAVLTPDGYRQLRDAHRSGSGI
ncbi:5-formyltetrahydrofolate cyclo-ligase [Bifidobacterium scaligerum]|uniref:5-formyltetrahydrofolate cyclo-ligase n=1 Tax=Bifidobacterium scaligerum TaxID=2052656 RepID=A0A2M9HRQ4_9BIFI|nr:5-formyltetrahydrofolate cyclo-ligase [Bifidobacterium scaligerum]PJM79492.1 5-formyltetrahydrofolate cyclo-ligase [Bifidobacterium scaligerum]